jgi:MFS family permease
MPSAVISDRFGRRSILIGGALIAALGNVLSGFAPSLETLIVYRFIAGIGSAAFITGAVVFIADISEPTNRGRLMSIFQGAFLIGITLGPAVGGFIAEVGGIRAPFIAIGVVSLISAVWAFLRVPETRWSKRDGETLPLLPSPPVAGEEKAEAVAAPPPSGRSMRGYSFLLRKDFLLISLTFAGTFFTRGGAMFTLLPLKASRELMFSPGQVGLLLTLPSVFTVLLLPFVGAISDRYGRKTVIVPGMALFAVALVVLGGSSTVLFFGMGMVLYGIAQGLEGPAPIAYVSDVSPREKQAVAQSAARSLGDLALFSAPPLMGMASDMVGTTVTLYGNAVFMVVITVLFATLASDPVRQIVRARRAQAAENE